MNWLKYLVGLAAIIIAASAAYFSVSGLTKLFAGSAIAIIIMASALEFAKLVAATYLKQRWNVLRGFGKWYLALAVAILMIITSAGIYGFLTSAYQSTFDKLAITEQQVNITNLKKQRYQDELVSYSEEKTTLSAAISDLTKGLSNNVIQYTDTAGNVVKTTSGATRRALESQLNDMKKQRDIVTSKIDVLNDSITSLDLKILDIQANNDLAAEVGPLRYLAKLTGLSMDTVVNWFTLSIVMVFDPLAIALIIAFNSLTLEKKEEDIPTPTQSKESTSQKTYEVYGEKKEKTPDNIQINSDASVIEIPHNNQQQMDFKQKVTDADLIDSNTELFDDISDLEPDIPKEIPTLEAVPAPEITPPPPLPPLSKYTEPRAEMRTPSALNEPIINKQEPELVYYMNPKFDWSNKQLWINDPNAVNYWIRHKRPKQEQSDNMIKKY